MSERIYAALLGVILLGSSARVLPQREQRGARIVGTVSPAFKVSIRAEWRPPAGASAGGGARVAVDSSGLKALEVTLSGSAIGGATQISLPLEIRSNEPYDLKLTLISEECSPAIAASIGSVRASGSAVVRAAGDVARHKGPIDLVRCLKPVTALHGPRVSRRGNFDSPGNALSADLNLSISRPAANECSWRIKFRISLHPSR